MVHSFLDVLIEVLATVTGTSHIKACVDVPWPASIPQSSTLVFLELNLLDVGISLKIIIGIMHRVTKHMPSYWTR